MSLQIQVHEGLYSSVIENRLEPELNQMEP